jgi:hypothetical protein
MAHRRMSNGRGEEIKRKKKRKKKRGGDEYQTVAEYKILPSFLPSRRQLARLTHTNAFDRQLFARNHSR